MNSRVDDRIEAELQALRDAGQYKQLKYLQSPMGPTVEIEGHGTVVMLCSNDYLGLANHPAVVEAGVEALRRFGAGTASVRFITGTFEVHRELEELLAELSGSEAALTYPSAWMANGALFPTVIGPHDVVISDELNHASIIDGIRASKPTGRYIYPHGDLQALEARLGEHRDAEVRWVVTDGVFSMEGDVADLASIAAICERHEAMLVVDDSHGVGVVGATGRGTAEHFGVIDKVDVLTGTLGKALGGSAGGYIAASANIVDLLIQRSRPGLFSNALPATTARSSKRAIQVMQSESNRLERLRSNVDELRNGLRRLGFDCPASDATPSAIIPIIVGETADAIAKSARLLELGVMVIGFGYPVVPKGQARLRIQASASLTNEHIDRALDAFARL